MNKQINKKTSKFKSLAAQKILVDFPAPWFPLIYKAW